MVALAALALPAGCSASGQCEGSATALSGVGDGGGDASAVDAAAFNLPPGAASLVPLTGCGGPGYAARFVLGSDVFDLTIDTGSGTVAVASTACTTCDVTPEYTPGASAQDEGRRVSDQYLMGSWQGEVYTDSVRVDGIVVDPVDEPRGHRRPDRLLCPAAAAPSAPCRSRRRASPG